MVKKKFRPFQLTAKIRFRIRLRLRLRLRNRKMISLQSISIDVKVLARYVKTKCFGQFWDYGNFSITKLYDFYKSN